MPCPRCGSSHITEEYKLVVCTDCGCVLDDSKLLAEGPRLGASADSPEMPGAADPRRSGDPPRPGPA